VVVALHEVSRAELSAEEAEQTRQQLERALGAGYGEKAMRAMLEALRARSEVVILEQNLGTDAN
jgi:hypothetical protein